MVHCGYCARSAAKKFEGGSLRVKMVLKVNANPKQNRKWSQPYI